MRFGTLDFTPALDAPALLAAPTAAALRPTDAANTANATNAANTANATDAANVLVAAIDPDLADTGAFCEHYGIPMGDGANCVIVQARRGERTWYAACLVRGADRLDVNGAVRRHLEARRLSFASMDDAVALSGMEYGGITPVGLPDDWPILVDASVAEHERLIVGSGIRGSKLLVTGAFLAGLPNAEVLPIAQAPLVG
ncbi:YbaK/EbsC family protein [Agromyces sp. NPDC058484]|uniref:YbaK/EbsC family protein n=1 Tax=Agromyces sp. NPDC058484 TaxID=3346524 RepID=UPI00365ACBCE